MRDIASVADRMHLKYSDRIFGIAKQAALSDRKVAPLECNLAALIAIFVIVIPLSVVIGGLYLIVTNFSNVPAMILGGLICLSAWAFFPRPIRLPDDVYSRDDLPNFYDVLDQIAQKLGTKAPEMVFFDTDYNASVIQIRRFLMFREKRALFIGFPLWQALTPQERIGLLAHELAHLVSKDPLRGQLFGTAHELLSNWSQTFSTKSTGDDWNFDFQALAMVIMNVVLGLPLRLVTFLFVRLTLVSSQCAEYRADCLAASVSGKEAMNSLLIKLTLESLADRAMTDLVPYNHPRNGRIFDAMGAAVSNAPPESVAYHYERAVRDKVRADVSHPPTSMRSAMIEALPESYAAPRLAITQQSFEKVDTELAQIKDALGHELMQYLYDTQINR